MRIPGGFALVNGDGAAGLRSLPAGKVKLVYGSPPYPNAVRDYGVWSSDTYLDFMAPFIDGAMSALSADGFLVLSLKACRDPAQGKHRRSTRSLVVERLACELVDRWGLSCVDIEIWVKQNPVPTGLRCAALDAYEQVLWFSRASRWEVHLDRIRQPYALSSLKTYQTTTYKPRSNGLTYIRHDKTIAPNDRGAMARNVVVGPVASGRSGHQARQPGYLAQRYILACTDEHDVVVDPWAGSGTTGIEALLYGRRFVGFETSRESALGARERLSEARRNRGGATQ